MPIDPIEREAANFVVEIETAYGHQNALLAVAFAEFDEKHAAREKMLEKMLSVGAMRFWARGSRKGIKFLAEDQVE